MVKHPKDRAAEAEKARRDVERMGEQDEKLLGATERPRPGDVNYDPSSDPNDPIEIWGKRIGRSLGYLFAAYLIYHLLTTYVFK